jgi:SNF family Na+-dependent transporter
LGWFLLTLALNVWILSRGLQRGVELTAKLLMPLLILFAIALAARGLTLDEHVTGAIASPLTGLNFVWEPRLDGLSDPATWLAAAGQIFFTLSVGMGSIHCFASYVKRDADIALNAASAGWVNEFVEVVLGGSILIPIATVYLGLERVQAATAGGDGFDLGFLSFPLLFRNWGAFAPIAGAMWFGLLFFAGITSSLAMGQPVMAFLEDEFKVERGRAALLFGAATLLLGALCVFFFPGGAFAEFNFWTGTFALVVFALGESIVFAWIFGMDRGWAEITRGAELRVPNVFRFVIRWITPSFLLVVFLAALVQPEGEWSAAWRSLTSGDGWPFAAASVIGRLLHSGEADAAWFDSAGDARAALVQDATRIVLLVLFAVCAGLVWLAWRRKRGGAP